MAKQVKAKVKMQLPGGGATPAPPVGSVLGQQGVALMDFCRQFNAQTSSRKGETVPVEITIYKDRSFDFVLKTPPTAELIRKRANISKGSSTPGSATVGQLAMADVAEIAKIKLPDLNAADDTAAQKTVMGTARSMGVKIID